MPIEVISAYNIDDKANHNRMTCAYSEITECPICHHALLPKVLSAHYAKNENTAYYLRTYDLHLLCFCYNCRSVFLCTYWATGPADTQGIPFRHLHSVSPMTPVLDSYSDAIKQLSPGFVETYTQAESAESQQLFQICGPGYRKALEILVKDYLCHIYPDDTEKIQSEPLGASINRIERTRIKTLAQRSTWIGNDETHYVRKHEDLGLPEMKRFIKAMLTYIDSELAFEEAESISRK